MVTAEVPGVEGPWRRVAGVLVQVRRAKVRCSSRWKSCPGKGRPGREGSAPVMAERQDVQDRRPDSSLPATGKGSFGVIRTSAKSSCGKGCGDHKLLRHRQFTGHGGSTKFAGPVQRWRSRLSVALHSRRKCSVLLFSWFSPAQVFSLSVLFF